jgi:hypothetical protein
MKKKICDKLIRREERRDEGYLYTYELTGREGSCVATWGLPLYSIRITLTDPSGGCREANARDVFSNIEKSKAFFDKLVNNLATPIDLIYVIEDEIG